MKGYLKNPKETADTIKDGWLRTGNNIIIIIIIVVVVVIIIIIIIIVNIHIKEF